MSFTDSQTSTLLTYFSNGMTGTGSKFKSQINAAVAETGLTERQVKNWITKRLYRSKETQLASSSNIPRKKRARSPWNVFQKEYASTEEGKELLRTNLSLFNKYASEKFQSLEDEDKARFVDDAASEDNSLTDAEIANRIRDIFGQLRDKTCKTLESYGCKAFVIGIRDKKVFLAGNSEVLKRIDDDRVALVHNIVFSGANTSETVTRKDEENALRKEVQVLFNTKYKEGTGRNGAFPYKRRAEFEIEGLPGVEFKKPSAYGTSQLNAILKIRIKDQNSSTTFASNSTSLSNSSSCTTTTSQPCLPTDITSISSPPTSTTTAILSGFTSSSSSSASTVFSTPTSSLSSIPMTIAIPISSSNSFSLPVSTTSNPSLAISSLSTNSTSTFSTPSLERK